MIKVVYSLKAEGKFLDVRIQGSLESSIIVDIFKTISETYTGIYFIVLIDVSDALLIFIHCILCSVQCNYVLLNHLHYSSLLCADPILKVECSLQFVTT